MASVGAKATGLPERQTAIIHFSFKINGIVLLLAAGLALRLALATRPGFGVDIGSFEAWANQLADHGPWNFYGSDFFTDYAPGYMYVLLLIGKLNQQFNFSGSQLEYILKLPSIAADLGSAYLLYRFLEGQRMELRLGAAGIYLAFPAALLIGSVWGQVDSLLAFFILLSVHFISKERPVAGAVAFTVGFLIKPQAVAALPFLAFWIMRDRWPNWSDERSIRDAITLWLKCVAAAFAVLLVLITPFFTDRPWDLITQLYNATNVENYRVNSFWAYNFWNMFGLFDMGFKCDVGISDCARGATNTLWLGVATRIWGMGMFLMSLLAVLWVMRRSRSRGALALGTSLCMLAFYMFVTRMHERYVFAFFLPFLAACVLLQSRVLWAGFATLGIAHFFNLYHVYSYYYPDQMRIDSIYKWFEKGDLLGTGLETVQVLSIVMFVSFLALLFAAYMSQARRSGRAEVT